MLILFLLFSSLTVFGKSANSSTEGKKSYTLQSTGVGRRSVSPLKAPSCFSWKKSACTDQTWMWPGSRTFLECMHCSLKSDLPAIKGCYWSSDGETRPRRQRSSSGRVRETALCLAVGAVPSSRDLHSTSPLLLSLLISTTTFALLHHRTSRAWDDVDSPSPSHVVLTTNCFPFQLPPPRTPTSTSTARHLH